MSAPHQKHSDEAIREILDWAAIFEKGGTPLTTGVISRLIRNSIEYAVMSAYWQGVEHGMNQMGDAWSKSINERHPLPALAAGGAR